MGFAGALKELRLPRSEFVSALLTFNVAVEAGQLGVIGAPPLLVGWYSADRIWYRRRIVVPASMAIVCTAVYWTTNGSQRPVHADRVGIETSPVSAAFGQQRIVATRQREHADWLLGALERHRQPHGIASHAADVSSTREIRVALAPRAAVFRGVRPLSVETTPYVNDDRPIDLATSAVILEQSPSAAHDHPYVLASP
jgi:HupE / UreJ protein